VAVAQVRETVVEPTVGPPAGGSGRIARVRGALQPEEWRRVAGMLLVVAGLHAAGFGLLIFAVAPHHLSLGAQSFGIGIGVTAYTLGMRHAFDVDHIAAIDNTTRKLMEEKTRPLSVGFWFSLGHSTVVFTMCVLLAFGVHSLVGEVRNDGSALHQVTGTVGMTVSGVFLLILGIINLVLLVNIVKVFKAMKTEAYDEETMEEMLQKRGFMNRILGRVMKTVRTPLQMYPVGLLFGFGFDTATEVSLLILASSSDAFALPWYAILCMPILFTAGMCLFDTIDGSFMNFAYGWAFSRPVRKVYYNMTVTSLSVFVALVIGGIELLSLLSSKLMLTGQPWSTIDRVGNFEYTGYLVVAAFVLTWGIALAIWKLGRIEDRWTREASAD
jgi:nickel/cobalt transporter (NiCoT) family protein